MVARSKVFLYEKIGEAIFIFFLFSFISEFHSHLYTFQDVKYFSLNPKNKNLKNGETDDKEVNKLRDTHGKIKVIIFFNSF